MTAEELQEQRARVTRDIRYACEDKAKVLQDMLTLQGDFDENEKQFHRICMRLWYLQELKGALHSLRFT